ncbi:SWIM zinc finger family protein [Streptomyces sp. NPDC051218]|uniref:SWIM zinc finger family protein n=1 Tax=Streptomyces sp. NPDC051218 TaxID=3365645 RepID=UPI0037B0A5A1
MDTITVAPGRIVAYVHGSRPRPYRAEIRMRTLAPEDWDGFLDAVATEPAHIAALLDKDMPHALVDAAQRAGVQHLPGPGDLVPSCTCPDHGRPCKHAAALTYQTARLLDADPFVLLLLRGGDEQALLDELAQRNAHQAAREQSATAEQNATGGISLPGTLARDILATDYRPPLPAPLPPPPHLGEPPLLPSLPGAPSPTSLEFLATDAASRAHAHLTTGADPFPAADPWHDAVRLAASHPGLTGRRTFSRQFTELARAVNHTPADLARAAAAWRQGGEDGLSVLESPWDPPAGPFDRARGALIAADLPRMTIRRNQLTDAKGTLQLRFGQDARWYPYRSEPGRDDWWPEGEADADPVGALSAAIGP